MDPLAITTVVDVGARYGTHPSWSGFGGELQYFAFEPDPEEADRLQQQNQRSSFEVVALALAGERGQREFYITRHRGYCSFYKPDLTSEWFRRYRPGEGEIESVIQVDTVSLDEWATKRQLQVDFLKIDTEGSELEILQGAAQQVANHLLGIRCEVHFQPCYQHHPLFSDISDHLLVQEFFLLNLDYFGRGVPRSPLFRNPNPLMPDTQRYGVMVGMDAVFLRNYDWVYAHALGDPAWPTLKYAYFCLLNSGMDVALETLSRFVTEKQGRFGATVQASQLYISLRRRCIEYLGQYRVNPEMAEWDLARQFAHAVFGLELEAGNRYWELLQRL